MIILWCGFEFYRLLANIKRHIIELESAPEDDQPQGSDYSNLNPKSISDTLLMLLDRQSTQLTGPATSTGTRLYHEARYIMVALADEVFLDLKWSGQETWGQNLLEEQVFQSQGAGDMFFRKLDKLLLEPGSGQIDLAKVYLMALALGFKGRYRLHDAENKIVYYMNRLYTVIFKRDPNVFEQEAQAFPQNYEHIMGKGESKWLPTIHKWRRIMLYTLLGGVILTHIFWLVLTSDLGEILLEIAKL